MSAEDSQTALRLLLFRLRVHVLRSDADLGWYGDLMSLRVANLILVARLKRCSVLLDRDIRTGDVGLLSVPTGRCSGKADKPSRQILSQESIELRQAIHDDLCGAGKCPNARRPAAITYDS